MNGVPTAWRLRLTRECFVHEHDRSQGFALKSHAAALVAVLALEDGPKTRCAVASMLWPNSPPHAARNSLKVLIHRLRRLTAADFIVGKETLALGPGVEVDDKEQVLPGIEAAPADLLANAAVDGAGEFPAWLHRVRQSTAARRRDQLTGIAAALEARGNYAEALRVVDVVLAQDPLDEFNLRRKLSLHFARGDRVTAIAEFERFERMLKDELGTRPTAETLNLLARIESSDRFDEVSVGMVAALLRTTPPFVGRVNELRRMEEAWSMGRSVLLLGEAAMGKSRLWTSFLVRHPGALAVQARPGDADLPFGLLSRTVRCVAGRFPSALSADDRQRLSRVMPYLGEAPLDDGASKPGMSVVAATERILAAAMEGGMTGLIIDDLHFGDEPSCRLIPQLFESERLRGLRWGFAQRPCESHHLAALQTVLESAQDLVRLMVPPLQEQDVVKLVELLGLPETDPRSLAAKLQKHCGGCPGFLIETLREMASDERLGFSGPMPAPAGTAQLVVHRLARLEPGALRLARVAAVAGADFSIDLAEHLTSCSTLDLADDWRSLEEARILEGPRFAFDLAYEVTLASLPREVARRLHAQVGTYLSDRRAPPGRVAYHLKLADDWQGAAEALLAAARIVRQDAGRAGEADLLSQAVACFDRAGCTDAAFAAMVQLAECRLITDQIEEAREAVVSLLARVRTSEERSQAWGLRAELRATELADDQALAWARETGELARQLGNDLLSAKMARLEAYCLGWLGRAQEALPIAQRLQAWALDHPRDAFAPFALNSCADTLQLNGRDQEALDLLESFDTESPCDDPSAALLDRLELKVELQVSAGRLEGAIDSVEQAVRVHRSLGGEAVIMPPSGIRLASLYRQAGRYQEALALAERGQQHFESTGNAWFRDEASIELAVLYAQLGQRARAQHLLRHDLDGLPPGMQLRWWRAHAVVAQEAERSAAESWRRCESLLGQIERPQQARWVLCASSAACLPVDEALARLRKCWAECAPTRNRQYDWPLRLSLIHSLLRAGQLAEAGELAASLHREIERLTPVGFYVPRYWLVIAQAHRAVGRDAPAATAALNGYRWLAEVAVHNVPQAFQADFLKLNEVNRQVLCWQREAVANGSR